MTASQRSRRVGELIQKEVSSLLIKGLKDPRIGFVTLTGVKVTPDLRSARIFVTVVGEEKTRRQSLEGLRSSIPFLRRELGKRLRLRYVPDLDFAYDTSLDYGERIESILRDLHDEETDAEGRSGED